MEIQPDESHALKGTFASTKLQKDLWWTSSLDTLREMQSSGTIGSSTHMAYPYGDLDGEDEGGQASSSLAVSKRWISAAKLLQSDLATLAQREGG
ncbi:hypothetical protein GW17_00051059 [Ensete ventricosum]|nr:hypothetical protein GW17_00051059 [Ensete ventricosum]